MHFKSDKELYSYIAGFCDGEGFCGGQKVTYVNEITGFTNQYYYLVISIANKDKRTLETIQKQTGLGKLYHTKKTNMYYWYLYEREAAKLIVKMLPYSINKKKELWHGLRLFYTKKKDKKEAVYHRLQYLKKHKSND